MLHSKTKSGLIETPSKTTPAKPKVSKLNKTSSKSEVDSFPPSQSSHLLMDRSPKSTESKSNAEHRSPKLNSSPDKLARTTKRSNMQEQLNVVQEDLKKAKERLASVEKEKAETLVELNEAKKLAKDATDKLSEALEALSKAEENTEIERFRTIDFEQAGIEASQQREDAWEKELDDVRNQHSLDVSALLSTTQELQKLQQELMMITEAKNTALSHADDAMKIAEINAEKVEILQGEVTRMKTLIDFEVESKNSEAAEQIQSRESEFNALRHEVEKAREAEKKLTELETLIEGLKIEVIDAKRAELDASNLGDEWKKKTELLEVKVEEAIRFERSSSETLSFTLKQLEDCNAKLKDSLSEIVYLKEKVVSLEIQIAKHKSDLDESEQQLEISKQVVLEMENMVEVLKSEIWNTEKEKMQFLENDKQMAASLQILLEEKDTILSDLDNYKDELDGSKKAMDDLASTLHEVSTEARESKEILLTKQAELGEAKCQIDELKHAIKSTEEKYMEMLSDAKDEIVCLEADAERCEIEAESSRIDWNRKEKSFMGSLKNLEEEANTIKGQLDAVVIKLREAELEVVVAKEENVQLLAQVKEAEMEAAIANEAVEKATTLSLRLKEVLLDKENELQNITQENDDLRSREEVALEKIKELSCLLEQVTSKKAKENGKLEKESSGVPDDLELSRENGCESKEYKSKSAVLSTLEDLHQDENLKKEVNGHNNNRADKAVEVDSEKLECYEVVDNGVSPEREHDLESVDDEAESKIDYESLYQNDGLSADSTKNDGSPLSSKEKQQKKKKAILSKFGNLLKKKNSQK